MAAVGSQLAAAVSSSICSGVIGDRHPTHTATVRALGTSTAPGGNRVVDALRVAECRVCQGFSVRRTSHVFRLDSEHLSWGGTTWVSLSETTEAR